MRIVNEFYVIIPFEYKNSGGVPATHYIDELTKFEQQPYYIGVLSASALHGAAHQSPQELQIVTSKLLPLIQAGRSRIRFLTKNNLSETPTQTMKTQTGYTQVSTLEATAFDLIRFPKIAAGLNNIATVLKELSEVMNADKLGQLATMTETAFVQRLGFLLDLVGVNYVGATVSCAQFEANLYLKIKDDNFIADVAPLLSIHATQFSAKIAAEQVSSAFLALLAGDPWKGPGDKNSQN